MQNSTKSSCGKNVQNSTKSSIGKNVQKSSSRKYEARQRKRGFRLMRLWVPDDPLVRLVLSALAAALQQAWRVGGKETGNGNT